MTGNPGCGLGGPLSQYDGNMCKRDERYIESTSGKFNLHTGGILSIAVYTRSDAGSSILDP